MKSTATNKQLWASGADRKAIELIAKNDQWLEQTSKAKHQIKQ